MSAGLRPLERLSPSAWASRRPAAPSGADTRVWLHHGGRVLLCGVSRAAGWNVASPGLCWCSAPAQGRPLCPLKLCFLTGSRAAPEGGVPSHPRPGWSLPSGSRRLSSAQPQRSDWAVTVGLLGCLQKPRSVAFSARWTRSENITTRPELLQLHPPLLSSEACWLLRLLVWKKASVLFPVNPILQEFLPVRFYQVC